jgi:ABC-type antimicrobial peptide transport system permease subunit
VLRDLGADLRFELRGLRRRPGFAALVVLSLALGIGAKAAIFSVLHALLLRPLPVREPERLAYFSDGLGSWHATRMTVRAGRLRAYTYPLSDNPISLALAAATLIAVATLAAYLPARRASRADAVLALR